MDRNEPTEPFLQVRHAQVDFSHARRRNVRLACCTCTTCCFTVLLAGVGGLAGLVVGVSSAARARQPERSVSSRIMLGLLRYLFSAVAYALAGILIGAAIGFGIDFLFIFR